MKTIFPLDPNAPISDADCKLFSLNDIIKILNALHKILTESSFTI